MATTVHSARPFGLVALASLVGCGLYAAYGPQAPPRTVEVAFVGSMPEDEDPSFREFRAALSRMSAAARPALRLRYHRGPAADLAAVRAAVAEAAALQPAVLVTPTADSTRAALSLASRPPVVFATFADPVQHGLVDSLRRPGRRATGVSLHDDLHLKRLEVLRDAYPDIRSVAMLVDRSWLLYEDWGAVVTGAYTRLGLQLQVAVADSADDVDTLMSEPSAGVDAWYVPATYVSYVAGLRIVEHLRRRRQPSMHTMLVDVARDGAPLAYAQDLGSEGSAVTYDAMAALVLRVARGEDAGEIPVERPRRFVLAVRAGAAPGWARATPAVVRRADRVY